MRAHGRISTYGIRLSHRAAANSKIINKVDRFISNRLTHVVVELVQTRRQPICVTTAKISNGTRLEFEDNGSGADDSPSFSPLEIRNGMLRPITFKIRPV